MSHSPGTGASLICHSCLLQLCCSYLSQPFWGMLNIRHIFLDRPNQEFPWACQLFPSFLQDTPPQPSPVPAPSPEAVTVQPVAHAQSPPAPLLSQAESSRACWSLGLMAGKDSDWRIVPTTGLLLGSQHWTASVSLLPTMPLVSMGSPAPPNPTPCCGSTFVLARITSSLAVLGPTTSPPVSLVPHPDPKGPSSAGGGYFQGENMILLPTSTATSWPQSPPPQHSRDHTGPGLPHSSHQGHSKGVQRPSGLQLPKHPGPKGATPSSGPKSTSPAKP